MAEHTGELLISTSVSIIGTTSTTVGLCTADVTVRQFKQTDYTYYTVLVVNNSTRTGVNVYVKAAETAASTDTYYANLTNFNVSAATTSAVAAEIRPVEGWLAGVDGRVTIANDSTLSTASTAAISAYLVVRKG
jgi:hypothetical protein